MKESEDPMLVVYPAPDGEPASQDYEVSVNGQPVFCYASFRYDLADPERIMAGPGMKPREVSPISFAYFDFEGEVTVAITAKRPFQSVLVRPIASGVKPNTEGNVIRFTLDRPGHFTVEPYGIKRPLHIFANAVEESRPDPDDPKVHYFAPGTHYIDPLEIADGETVYIAGGAIVYANVQQDRLSEWDDMVFQEATFLANGKKGVSIKGRGMICGRYSFDNGRRHKLIEFQECEEVKVEGVILRESSGWSMAVRESERIHVDNVRIVGYYINNDGIDICSSRHALIENCFCHNADDSFLIKADQAPVSDVLFKNCVAWNDVATSFGIINETSHEVKNVIFRDCIVLHSTLPCWIPEAGGVLAIWNDRGGNIHDVLFENILVEDACKDKPAIKLNITNLVAGNTKREGLIQDIGFRNIEFLQTDDDRIVLVSSFLESAISRIRFHDVKLNGLAVSSSADSRFEIHQATDIQCQES